MISRCVCGTKPKTATSNWVIGVSPNSGKPILFYSTRLSGMNDHVAVPPKNSGDWIVKDSDKGVLPPPTII